MRQMMIAEDEDLKPAVDEYAALLRALAEAGDDTGGGDNHKAETVDEVIRWLVANFTELPSWEVAEDIATRMQTLGLCSSFPEACMRSDVNGDNDSMALSGRNRSFARRRVDSRSGMVMECNDKDGKNEEGGVVVGYESIRLAKIPMPARENDTFKKNLYRIATERAVRGKDDFEKFAGWPRTRV